MSNLKMQGGSMPPFPSDDHGYVYSVNMGEFMACLILPEAPCES